MKIYTSYFAKQKALPDSIVPISICGKSPDWYNGLEFRQLAPKYGFFSEWKKNHDNNYYIQHYYDEVLKYLNPEVVYSNLIALSSGKDVAVLCYENRLTFATGIFSENG